MGWNRCIPILCASYSVDDSPVARPVARRCLPKMHAPPAPIHSHFGEPVFVRQCISERSVVLSKGRARKQDERFLTRQTSYERCQRSYRKNCILVVIKPIS